MTSEIIFPPHLFTFYVKRSNNFRYHRNTTYAAQIQNSLFPFAKENLNLSFYQVTLVGPTLDWIEKQQQIT